MKKEKKGTIEEVVMSHERALDNVLKVIEALVKIVHKQHERIAELEKDLSELTITNNYQRVISEKNEQISALEIELEEARRRS